MTQKTNSKILLKTIMATPLASARRSAALTVMHLPPWRPGSSH
jgi:hypothetical protein